MPLPAPGAKPLQPCDPYSHAAPAPKPLHPSPCGPACTALTSSWMLSPSFFLCSKHLLAPGLDLGVDALEDGGPAAGAALGDEGLVGAVQGHHLHGARMQ